MGRPMRPSPMRSNGFTHASQYSQTSHGRARPKSGHPPRRARAGDGARRACSRTFERAVLHNARESLLHDAGCLRFDVSQDAENPLRWVMHEVYDRVGVACRAPPVAAFPGLRRRWPPRPSWRRAFLRGRGVHIPA